MKIGISVIALVGALAIGSTASAADVSVSGGYKANDGSSSNEVVNVDIAQSLAPYSFIPAPLKGFTVDANFQDDVNRPGRTDVQKYDFGAKTKVYGPVWVRGAIGYDVSGGPGGNSFSYWSVTTGASIPATQIIQSPLLSKVALEGSIRYRNAFSSLNNFSTFTFKGGFGYALSKNTVLHAYVDRETGDRNNVETGLGLTQTF